MGRTQRFTKNKILNTAYDLFNESGCKDLKIRSIAKACHSSVYPIYSLFISQKELYDAVIDLAFHRLKIYLETFIPLYSTSKIGTNLQFARAIQKTPGIVKEVNQGNMEIINRLVAVAEPFFSEIPELRDPKRLEVHLVLIISVISAYKASNNTLTSFDFNEIMKDMSTYLEPKISI